MKYKMILFILPILFFFQACFEEKKEMIKAISPENDLNKLNSLSSYQDSIKSLISEADLYFKSNKNSEKGQAIRCDSIPNLIQGLQIDAVIFNSIDNEIVDLSEIKKPIFLQVTSAWSSPRKTEISALNKIVEMYSDKIEFILLFAEDSTRLIKNRENYRKEIKLIPNEQWQEQDNKVVISNLKISGFTHLLGFPFNYYIAGNKKIVKVEIGDLKCSQEHPKYYKDNFELIFGKMKNHIEYLLNHENS